MNLFIIFALGQVAMTAPPPPPVAFEDWAALQPIEKSYRASVLCRAGGRITAEFALARGVVSVKSIEGISHILTPSERVSIDAAVRSLGYLDRVGIGCNGQDALISVLGGFSEINHKMMRRSVSIVWQPRGISGMGGRTSPEMELLAEQR